MYQSIRETIAVVGSYEQGKRFRPYRFLWHDRVYRIGQITLVTESRDGGISWRQYSVVSAGTLYRLAFDRDHERWVLEAIWVE